MNQQKTLENIGLSPTESEVYLAGLTLGKTLPATLAKQAKISRPTLYYDVLPKLIEKGLIIQVIQGKRKYFLAQDLQHFLDSKKKQLEEVEQLLPQLRSLLATANTKPQLLVYEGIEGIKKVWFDHLAQRQPIVEFVGIENIHPQLQKYLKEHYIWERAKRNIPVKMLISGSTIAGIFNVVSDSVQQREVRRLNGSLFPIPLSCDVYGDNVSFTLHRKDSEPIGLIIRSKEIAIMMHSVFEALWQGAEK